MNKIVRVSKTIIIVMFILVFIYSFASGTAALMVYDSPKDIYESMYVDKYDLYLTADIIFTTIGLGIWIVIFGVVLTVIFLCAWNFAGDER